MQIHICQVCQYVAYGESPDKCPICEAGNERFIRNDHVFEESEAKSKEGAIKHIPSVTVKHVCGLIPEESCTDVLVRVGKTLHPTTDTHYIMFIDCYVDHKLVARAHLTPNSYPSVVFHLKEKGSKVQVTEFCSLHGHWQAETNF